MNKFTEVTAETLKIVRISKNLSQEEVAEILGLEKHNISKIETGVRLLADSEKKLLDWYFFGTLPPSVVATLDLQGVLEFTDDEWHIIGMMARAAGQSEAKWIRESILSFVALRGPGKYATGPKALPNPPQSKEDIS